MNFQRRSKYEQYPEILSSTKSINKKSENGKFSKHSQESVASCSSSILYPSYNQDTRKPCQSDLDSLVVELKLPKNKSEVLTDFFKKRNFTDGQVLSTSHRKRNYKFASYFERNGYCACI
ncbi:hypothetical protein A3Q56_07657 [Intoshia linei]|uniref:Uncharacterized protein n=1 Tax=Intoshia linei TaxID=1819745 RepID=A0A177ARJ2_9BILA|nr:hypothetical protein A3Q56_07657 [Intoshia linei]